MYQMCLQECMARYKYKPTNPPTQTALCPLPHSTATQTHTHACFSNLMYLGMKNNYFQCTHPLHVLGYLGYLKLCTF